jgi:hypothetical protein
MRSSYDSGSGKKVVRAGLIFIAVFLLLGLVSCGVFTSSPFPANLPFVSAFIDLEEDLGSFLDDRRIDEVDYLFNTLRDDSERDYLFLILRLKDTGDIKLLIFDSNLDKCEEMDYGEIGRFMVFNPNSALLPSGREFVIGCEVFDGEGLEHRGHLQDFGVLPGDLPDSGAVGFARQAAGQIYWVYVDDSNHFIIDYDFDNWTFYQQYDNLLFVDQRHPFKLTYDLERDEAVIFIRFFGDVEIVRYPGDHFPFIDIYGVPAYPFATNFDAGMIVFSDVDDDTQFSYTQDGIIKADEDGSMKRYDFSGHKEDDWELDPGYDYIITFDIEGDFYYYFNFNERRLYKAHVWWD